MLLPGDGPAILSICASLGNVQPLVPAGVSAMGHIILVLKLAVDLDTPMLVFIVVLMITSMVIQFGIIMVQLPLEL